MTRLALILLAAFVLVPAAGAHTFYWDPFTSPVRFDGHPHRDVVDAAGGRDILHGRGGRDVLRGRRGRDDLFGNAGRDRLYGGGGFDFLDGGAGADYVDCGGGRDVAVWDPLDTYRNCETFVA